MQPKQDTYDVGAIVGRFQVHELHDAHRELIQHVIDQHDKVVVLLGLSPLRSSTSNPLDYEARKQLILEEFPNVIVAYIEDVPSDSVWSKKLDKQLRTILTPSQTARLYGGRDGFIKHYKGTFPAQELESEAVMSGTAVRRKIKSGGTKATSDFRAGVIWATGNRFPTAYSTVDVAILQDVDLPGRELEHDILLGRKEHEQKFRLIGGFVDPTDGTKEAACRREVQEEAGISITDPQYVTSMRVDDWRYRDEPDAIMTTLFKARRLSGRPEPGDDIDEVRWFDLALLGDSDVVTEHLPLIRALKRHLGY